MSKNNDKWNNFIKQVRGFGKDASKMEEFIRESEQENHENFLFVAAGDGVIVRGMHYPDSAFEGDDFPLVFNTFDAGVVIAAWPRNHIKTILQTLENNFEEAKHEKLWEMILEGLVEDASAKIKEGDVGGI